MANIKITDLDAYADPKSTDVLPAVDVTNDETKKVSIADLMENAGSGTEAAPGIAFDGDPNTGIYRPGADQLAISTAGAQRLLISDTGAVTIPGDLTVQGTTTFIDTETLQVEDKNIEIGKVASPTDLTADGGGVTLLGSTNKTLNWVNSTDSWTSSENIDLASGKTYKINGTDVLSATALGSAVQISSDNIPSGTIVNDDVNASAAIAGTKIDPDFGSQTVETTGVFSAAGGAQATPSITFTGDLNTGIYSPGADQVAISTGGSGRLFVDASGRVGVGTSPSYPLHVSANDGQIALFQRPSGATNFTVKSSATTTLKIDGTDGVLAFVNAGGATPAYTIGRDNTDNTLRISQNSSAPGTNDLVTINSSGRVGIGAQSLEAPLHVRATGGSVNSLNTGLIINYEATGAEQAGAGTAISFRGKSGGGGISNYEQAIIATNTTGGNNSHGLSFYVKPSGALATTEAVRINNSGRLGIGDFNPAATVTIKAATGVTPFTVSGPSLEFAKIDTSGRLLVGTSSAPGAGNGQYGKFIVQGNTISNHGLLNVQSNTASASIANNTQVGEVQFTGSDGYVFANIICATDGIAGTNDYPGRLVFSTTPDGGSSPDPRMTIKADGKVGIGTENPIRILQLNGEGNHLKLTTANTGTGASDGFDIKVAASNSEVQFLNYESSDLSFWTNTSPRATIDSSGRLLVGTSTARSNFYSATPELQLEKAGDRTRFLITGNANTNQGSELIIAKTRGTTVGSNTVVQSGDNIGNLHFAGADGTNLVIGAAVTAFVDGTPGANDMPGRLVFSTTADGGNSPTERMRIGQDGLVYIRATAYSGDAPNNVGFVFNPIVGNCKIRCSGDGTAVMQFYSPTGGTSGPVGSIVANPSTTSYNTSSDYRLKENVVPLTGAADRLNQLQVHRFNFIADPDTTVDGFIAHEAQAVVPEAVTGTHDEVDADGNPVYQGIDQSKLVPLLTAALQEALAKIETLEARLTAAGI